MFTSILNFPSESHSISLDGFGVTGFKLILQAVSFLWRLKNDLWVFLTEGVSQDRKSNEWIENYSLQMICLVAVEGPCSSEQGGLAPRQPVVRDPLTGAQDMGEGDGAVGLGVHCRGRCSCQRRGSPGRRGCGQASWHLSPHCGSPVFWGIFPGLLTHTFSHLLKTATTTTTVDFPGSPVAKISLFHHRENGFDPLLGKKDPTCLVVWPKYNNNNKSNKHLFRCHSPIDQCGPSGSFSPDGKVWICRATWPGSLIPSSSRVPHFWSIPDLSVCDFILFYVSL